MVGRRSLWIPGRRHHQSLWQARTNFSQDKCTRCSPSKWPIVGALPDQYLRRGPGPSPINRTSLPQDDDDDDKKGIGNRQRERKVSELLLAVHRPSHEQTLARLVFLVLFIIISPRGNPPHHTEVGYYTTSVARTSINPVSLVLFFR